MQVIRIPKCGPGEPIAHLTIVRSFGERVRAALRVESAMSSTEEQRDCSSIAEAQEFAGAEARQRGARALVIYDRT